MERNYTIKFKTKEEFEQVKTKYHTLEPKLQKIIESAKPLDVIWVCRKCHNNIHKMITKNTSTIHNNLVGF